MTAGASAATVQTRFVSGHFWAGARRLDRFTFAVVTDGGARDGHLTRVLGSHADDLAEAAEQADDPETTDAYTVLAAVARGESPPRDAARRVVDRL